MKFYPKPKSRNGTLKIKTENECVDLKNEKIKVKTSHMK